jgi:ribosomal protein S18 acetylase RimI-like enzyme/SAM-dependent methyltransferase
MSNVHTIYRKAGPGDMSDVRFLIREYVNSMALDLSFQGLDEELENLPGKYAEPEGAIIVAVAEDALCGCIAMKKLGEGICEMKRLYVGGTHKGKGIGKELVRRIIEEARGKGYRVMRLDTLSTMKPALALYREFGFREIASYVYNPIEGAVFMEKDLVDVVSHNREAWNKEVAEGNMWTKPVGTLLIENARKGDWTVLLTPTIPVPKGWFGNLAGKSLLCLASGGGQQGPILTAAGAKVTVFDNSPAQLAQDRLVAEREGMTITLEQGDMRDLSRFPDKTFDIVFHPVSNIFIDDVKIVWKECFRVLKEGGIMLAGFVNPLLYIFDLEEADRNGAIVVRYKIPYSDVGQLPRDLLESRMKAKEALEFGHSLDDLIGGQLAAGFVIDGFFEDSSGGDFLDPYIKTFIATRAVKDSKTRTAK